MNVLDEKIAVIVKLWKIQTIKSINTVLYKVMVSQSTKKASYP